MAEIINSAFTYMGCKSDLLEWIIPEFPKHRVYVELFSGTYVVGLNKPKAYVEIYNDMNGDLSNLFLQMSYHYEELSEKISEFIMSREWYSAFKSRIDAGKYSTDIERAAMFYFVMCTTFRGKFDGGFSWKIERSFTEVFERKKENLKLIHERIKNVIVLNHSCFELLAHNTIKNESESVIYAHPPISDEMILEWNKISLRDDNDILIYADPPYVDTESYYKSKAGEFGLAEHIKLRDMLAEIKGTFFVSYEDDQLVRDLYSDFRIITKEVTRGSSGIRKTEVLATNAMKAFDLFNQI